MTLTAYPCKLSPGELEAHLAGESLPLPGQVARLSGMTPVYAQVLSVQSDQRSETEEKYRQPERQTALVRFRILHGSPLMTPGAVQILSPVELAQAVQSLQAPIEHPIHLGPAGSLDFFRLGALTVIQGDDFLRKYEALTLFLRAMESYQRVLLLDPLGVAMPGEGLSCLHAGKDVRLSLQEVGGKPFLDSFAELLPATLQEAGLRTLANLLPTSPEPFIGFQSLFALEVLAEAPLKNLILQNLHMVAQARVFANTPDEVFSLERVLSTSVNVLDLSPVPDPWKRLFYTEICRNVLRNAGGDVALALIHPEHYLSEPSEWVRQANDAELNLLALISPYPTITRTDRRQAPDGSLCKGWNLLAGNHVQVEPDGQALLQGKLTLGLPIHFRLNEAGPNTHAFSPETHRPLNTGALSAATFPEPFAETTPSQPPLREEAALTQPLENRHPSEEVSLTPAAQAPPCETFPSEPPPESPTDNDTGLASTNEKALPPSLSNPEVIANNESDWEGMHFAGESGNSLPNSHWSEPEAPRLSAATPLPPEEEEENELWLPDFDAALLDESAPSTPTHAETLFEPLSPPQAEDEDEENDLLFNFDLNLVEEGEYESLSVTSASSFPTSSDIESPSPPMPEELTDDGLSDSPDSIPAPAFVEEPPPVYQRETIVSSTIAQDSYHVGDRVRHPTYGSGVIVKVLPMGEQLILNITFDQVGKRLLDPALCSLGVESEDSA